MRAVFLSEELMGVALKFSKKSSTMGSLLVSWEQTSSPEKNTRKGLFTGHSRILQTSLYLCLATILFIAIIFCFVSALDSSTAAVIHLNPAQSEPRTDTGQAALQGLGTIFRRGSRSMSELLVAHLSEDLSESELRIFLRTLHRSGISARADIVLLFDGDPRMHRLAYIVEEESQAFALLLSESGCLNGSSPYSDSDSPSCGSGGGLLLLSNCSLSRLNLEAFARAEEEKRGKAEAALAKQRKLSNITEEIVTSSPVYNRILLGSVMGFDIAELDPLDTLSGFVDKPPIQLRRWLCYQMLLGMAKQHHRYRQILITQARGVFIFNDTLLALSRRHKDARGLVLVAEDRTWLEEATSDSRKSREILSDEEDEEESSESEVRKPDNEVRKSGSRKKKRRRKSAGLIEEVYGRQIWGSIEREDKAGWTVVSSAVLAGGSRAVRTLADAVATEVARAAMMRRSRRAFSDQAALNYVVRRNSNVLGRKVVERMIFVGGVAGVRVVTRDAGLPDNTARYDVVVVEGDSGDLRGQVTERIVKDLCSSPRERAVYNDCRES